MQISSNYNLPILSGYSPERQSRQTNSQDPQNHAQTQSPQPPRQTGPAIVLQRQPIYSQPLFNQNLTYRGEQAARTYYAVESGGEVELMNRLDEIA